MTTITTFARNAGHGSVLISIDDHASATVRKMAASIKRQFDAGERVQTQKVRRLYGCIEIRTLSTRSAT